MMFTRYGYIPKAFWCQTIESMWVAEMGSGNFCTVFRAMRAGRYHSHLEAEEFSPPPSSKLSSRDYGFSHHRARLLPS